MSGLSSFLGRRMAERRVHALHITATGCLVMTTLLALVAGAAGAPAVLCMKSGAANAAVKGPTVPGGTSCKAGYSAITLPSTEELETLNKVMPHVKYQAAGVGGKPTIQFSGTNVQILSGAGKTNAAVNGEGNLVIGYDEFEGKPAQTGSHNLILGEQQSFTSYGGILAGFENSLTAPWAFAAGGANKATGEASVVAGLSNLASGPFASVSGGRQSTATGQAASVSGGFQNSATQIAASVGGGDVNVASGEFASVSGGGGNTASGGVASISGGTSNTASGSASSVSGGTSNISGEIYGSILGGCSNLTGSGTNQNPSCSGLSTPSANSISGGYYNRAQGVSDSVLGGFNVTLTGAGTHSP